jgi:hypothetical protein
MPRCHNSIADTLNRVWYTQGCVPEDGKLPVKELGLGLCRAVPAVTPHLPSRAGRGSPLASIAGGNVSPAAGRLVAACHTGLLASRAVTGGSTQPGL